MTTEPNALRVAARYAVAHIEVPADAPFASATEDDYADAASDVWEPVLAEVLDMADGTVALDRHRLAEIRAQLGDLGAAYLLRATAPVELTADDEDSLRGMLGTD